MSAVITVLALMSPPLAVTGGVAAAVRGYPSWVTASAFALATVLAWAGGRMLAALAARGDDSIAGD